MVDVIQGKWKPIIIKALKDRIAPLGQGWSNHRICGNPGWRVGWGFP